MNFDNRDPVVLVSQCYRDEAEEMEAAEGHFLFDAPEPRPHEEQVAFDRASEREAPFPLRALGNGCFESAK
jgi:hypothetical protein